MQTVLFEFEATECNGWPKIRIGIDGDVLVDHDFTSSYEYVKVNYDVVDGAHTFDIERWGKQNFNIVHDQGIILQDQTVTLKNIWVQDVCLPEWVKSQGTFRFDDVTLLAGLTWGTKWCVLNTSTDTLGKLDCKTKHSTQWLNDWIVCAN